MTRFPVILVALMCWLLSALPLTDARAAVEQPKTAAIYVKIDGIPGGSTDEQHKGEIEALSFNWSAKLKEGKDGAGSAEPHDALVLKPIDAATPKLMAALAGGMVIPEVTVTARGTTPGSKAAGDYLVYTFTDVRLTVVSHAVVGGAQEQVQFKYGRVRVRFQPADGKATEETWDTKAKGSAKGEKP